MERKNMWEHYTEEQERELEELAVRYRKCLDQSKTERECVTLSIAMAAENGYQNIAILFDCSQRTKFYESRRTIEYYTANTFKTTFCIGG